MTMLKYYERLYYFLKTDFMFSLCRCTRLLINTEDSEGIRLDSCSKQKISN